MRGQECLGSCLFSDRKYWLAAVVLTLSVDRLGVQLNARRFVQGHVILNQKQLGTYKYLFKMY